jgi:hypothetical protein
VIALVLEPSSRKFTQLHLLPGSKLQTEAVKVILHCREADLHLVATTLRSPGESPGLSQDTECRQIHEGQLGADMRVDILEEGALALALPNGPHATSSVKLCGRFNIPLQIRLPALAQKAHGMSLLLGKKLA